MNDIIYLDNAATTEPYSLIDINYRYRYFDNSRIWMNPSALYSNDLRYIQEVCKKTIINDLTFENESNNYDMIFTSGATESNNWVLHNIILNNLGKMYTPSIIVSPFEHPSVINTLKYYQKKNLVRIVYLDVDMNGHVVVNSLHNAIGDCENPVLVTCMWINNEIGSIQPIEELGKICEEYNLPFHVDATQAIGKIDNIYMYQGISSISFSGHKFHGPKGIGGLLIRKDFLSEIGPFIIGGHQQNGYRAGTEDVDKLKLFMYSFLEAQEDIYDLRGHSKFIHNYFQEEIKRVCNEDMFVINSKDDVVPIINISFKNISGEYIVKELAKDNIFISTGSACSTGDLSVSDTIKAIGVPVEYQEGTIRISFDKNIGGLHIKTFIDKLVKIFQN